jgi:hypothetical protein
VLKHDGSGVVWADDSVGGLTLPYSGSGSSAAPLFQIDNSGAGTALRGRTITGKAVYGSSDNGIGVHGVGYQSDGVKGSSTSAVGVRGESTDGDGVLGSSTNGVGGFFASTNGIAGGFWGPVGIGADTADALEIVNDGSGRGVHVTTAEDTGVWIETTGASAYAALDAGRSSTSHLAARFRGRVEISGTVSKGGGSFKIDHPLDPANRYLYHSFVESPDMMNLYNGNVVTDEHGFATVTLPDWFEALNRDFRYQLTVIGAFAQAIVAQEIEHNRFVIRSDRPGVKVSWQVTGVRHDAFAEAHRIPVEEDKPDAERGLYLHAEAFGLPPELAITREGEHEIVPVLREREGRVSRPGTPDQ